MDSKLYKLLILSGFFSLAVSFAFAQNAGFVQQEKIKIQGITTDAQIYGLPLTQKQTTRAYYDGLGRSIQTVAVQASPSMNDLIQPVAYDNLGRRTKSYLPYAGKSTDVMGSYRPNAISTDQPAFYNQTSQYVIPTDGSPFTRQVFENSPLQRLLNAGTAGSGYQPGVANNHYKTVNHRANGSTDGNILVWNRDGTFSTGNYYPANSLAVTDGIDEDGREILSFTDLAGNTILKRQLLNGTNLDTYYIYNNAGMVSYIVPPAATNVLSANSYNLTAAPLSNLVFHYMYNARGQVTQKLAPAKGVVSIVYDPLNRPVLVQDANMAASHQWNYIKYDASGRTVSQGIYTDANNPSYSAMQMYVNTFASVYATTWYESRSGAPVNSGYYTNTVFPTGLAAGTSLTPLAYAYYDDYDLNQDGTPDFTYISQGLSNEIGATTAQLKGVPTVVSETTVGAGISGTWLTKVTFYDRRGNAIQTMSNNHVYYTGSTALTDVQTVVPDFTGVPQITKVSKKTGASTTTTVLTTLSYDQSYRLTNITQAYNGGTASVVGAYSYNEAGQLIKKNLGQIPAGTIPVDLTLNTQVSGSSTVIASNSIILSASSPGFSTAPGATFSAFISTGYLQTVDYRYNIRGQLLSINNSKLSNDGGITNNDNTDLFGMQFMYDQVDTNLGDTAYYNGKLSAVKWMSKDASGNSSYERAYLYSYDGIDRYRGETYTERATTGTGSFGNNLHGFDESGIRYDAGGNILTLNRNSSAQGANSNTPIDALTYTYSTINPNQLLKVTDATSNAAGFNNYTSAGSSSTYGYDGTNGNLVSDPYKGLSIGYNVLNRTDKITFTAATNQWIDYTYDASGNLLRKRQYDNNVLQTTTDYIDGFVYLTAGTGTAVLSYFPIPEGRVLNNSGTLVQEFIITDQQGNARLSFQNNGSGAAVVKQENSYYGFGMLLPNSPVATSTIPNKKLYNGGSEWQNDFSNLPDYQQTFFRNYDAALGRWIAVDPEAESAESMSTYQYAGNNPILGNDPMGNKFKLVEPTESAGGGSIGPGEGQTSADFAIWSDAVSLNEGHGGGGGTAGYTAYSSGAVVSAPDNSPVADNPTGSVDNSSTPLPPPPSNIQHDPNHVVVIQARTPDPIDYGDFWNGLNGVAYQGGGPVPHIPALNLLTVLNYGVYNGNGTGGLSIKLGFKNYFLSGLTNFNFVQTIRTNVPLGGAHSPYNDPQPPDDNLPFYWTNSELPGQTNQNGFNVLFSDRPSRGMQNGTTWQAELSLVGMNSTGRYVPITTITYGFQIINNSVVLSPITTTTPSAFQRQSIP